LSEEKKNEEERIIEEIRKAFRRYGKADAVIELVIETLVRHSDEIEKVVDTLAGFECRIKKLEEWRQVH
jgi:uncharacterized protein YaaN involved in tellurite resistance